MKISYNMTKWTTKTEKFEKILKMYIITLGLKAINWLTGSGSISNLILSYKIKRDLLAIYGYQKNKNRLKQQFQEKNWARKVSKALKMNFPLKLVFSINF